jgi:serine/threonine-protein kinase RsbT
MSRPIAKALEARLPIREEADIVMARVRVRGIARHLGLSERAMGELATALSEVARNIVVHAGRGEIQVALVHGSKRSGIVVVARDNGPGIADLEQAMLDGYSTAKSLGLGLSSARRLMDEFQVTSITGKGTTITMTKWVT